MVLLQFFILLCEIDSKVFWNIISIRLSAFQFRYQLKESKTSESTVVISWDHHYSIILLVVFYQYKSQLQPFIHYQAWKQHIINAELYGDLPKITQIRERRTKFAGLYARSEECVYTLVNWTPKHGMRKLRRPALNYIDILKQDTDLHASDVITAMQDRKVWRAIVDRGLHPN